MADDGAAGSTFSFGTTAQTDMRSIDYDDQSNEVDVTVLLDGFHSYVSGIEDVEVTVECLGVSTINRGDVGAIAIGWNDGSSDGLGTNLFLCTGVTSSGSVDGEITSTLTFRPNNIA